MTPAHLLRRGFQLGNVALSVVLIYAVFAALWILLSDKAVAWLFSDPEHRIIVSTIKGWLFVAVTTLLLYVLLRRFNTGAPPLRPAGRPLLLPLALLGGAIVIIAGTGIAYTFKQTQARGIAQLQTIADLKVHQIGDWLQERQRDAEFIRTSDYYATQYQLWQGKGDSAAGDRLKNRLMQFIQDRGFSRFKLLDPAGRVLWNSAGANEASSPAEQEAAQRAVRERKAVLIAPYQDGSGHLHIDFISPLSASPGALPLVVTHLDTEGWLASTLKSWPIPGTSGETVLFRRDGDAVLFFGVLRHSDTTAGPVRLPLATPDLPAAKVLRGEAALNRPVYGLDYRKVPVVGIVSSIPGTDWYLGSKLDRQEIEAEASNDTVWIVLTSLLALFITGAGLSLLRQREQLAAAESLRQSQAERLQALQLLDAIAESSDDLIYAKDIKGRYTLFNRAAGHVVDRAPASVIGQDDRALFPEEQAEAIMASDYRVIGTNQVETLEESLDTAQGRRTFSTTKGTLRDAGGKLLGSFGISRDITARKHAEEQLRQRNEELERFNRATVGRELDMIELKKQINALSRELGRDPPFPLAFARAEEPAP